MAIDVVVRPLPPRLYSSQGKPQKIPSVSRNIMQHLEIEIMFVSNFAEKSTQA